jgi:pimeloyl-ACP methyl ester carboxylesterase
MQPTGIKSMATDATNIVLVHGGWGDGSAWSKEISILQNAGHKVIAVQLPLHSLADDVATVKRAIDHIGGPVILVGHSYGGAVITNAGYNNPKVTGLFTLQLLLQTKVSHYRLSSLQQSSPKNSSSQTVEGLST